MQKKYHLEGKQGSRIERQITQENRKLFGASLVINTRHLDSLRQTMHQSLPSNHLNRLSTNQWHLKYKKLVMEEWRGSLKR
ncbi:hypothetical protein L484_010450 [Morus notabilis]|uniref:Uncharacterized protein n=1 Tax=Morus notabilis TaxID=981085 RepID=W9QLX5_9ROSA|nr:hypothetical protein L484_010450 [Morus notabilis]